MQHFSLPTWTGGSVVIRHKRCKVSKFLKEVQHQLSKTLKTVKFAHSLKEQKHVRETKFALGYGGGISLNVKGRISL